MADGWLVEVDDPPADAIETVVRDEQQPEPDGSHRFWPQRYVRMEAVEDGKLIYRFEPDVAAAVEAAAAQLHRDLDLPDDLEVVYVVGSDS